MGALATGCFLTLKTFYWLEMSIFIQASTSLIFCVLSEFHLENGQFLFVCLFLGVACQVQLRRHFRCVCPELISLTKPKIQQVCFLSSEVPPMTALPNVCYHRAYSQPGPAAQPLGNPGRCRLVFCVVAFHLPLLVSVSLVSVVTQQCSVANTPT